MIGSDLAPMPSRAEVERLHADFLGAVADGTRTIDALEAVPEVDPDPVEPFTFPEPVSATEIPF